MIPWKQVKDEKPPLDKKILYAIPAYRAKDVMQFDLYIATISHPFSKNDKYHPDYYLYHVQEPNGYWREYKVKPEHYWAIINKPETAE